MLNKEFEAIGNSLGESSGVITIKDIMAFENSKINSKMGIITNFVTGEE
jgi:hypothetical protein